MTDPSIFNTLLIWPITNLLIAVYQALSILGVPYALGFAIIVLSVLFRIVLYPLTNSQLRTSKKMQDLAPHLSAIKTQHKNDKRRVQEETMKLYKEHGVNPAAGCLPVVAMIVVSIALYTVLSHFVALPPKQAVAEINKIVYVDSLKLKRPWDQSFFGIPIEKNPSQLLSSMPAIVLIPIFTALFQAVQAKMMFPQAASLPVRKKEGEKNGDMATDFSSAMQKQSLFIFPLILGYTAFVFPLGVSLYWNTFTLFGILQQYRVAGLGGISPWVEKIKRIV